MNRIVLDTNAYTRFAAGKDRELLELANNAEKIILSSIVVGELLSGFRGGSRFLMNRRILVKFLSKEAVEVASVTVDTAEIYSEIKYHLRKKGTPIPTNDIWIAASTIETGSVLVSYDTHFLSIPGLRVWDELRLKN